MIHVHMRERVHMPATLLSIVSSSLSRWRAGMRYFRSNAKLTGPADQHLNWTRAGQLAATSFAGYTAADEA